MGAIRINKKGVQLKYRSKGLRTPETKHGIKQESKNSFFHHHYKIPPRGPGCCADGCGYSHFFTIFDVFHNCCDFLSCHLLRLPILFLLGFFLSLLPLIFSVVIFLPLVLIFIKLYGTFICAFHVTAAVKGI